MKCCDEICSLPMMASIFLVFVSVLVIILLVYRAIKPSKNDSVIERQYRFRFGLNVFSMSLCIILLISVLVSSTVKLNSGNVDATDFYTAFIALCTTFVVGFQIYSSIDLNKKIEKLDKEKKRINNQIKELKELNKTCEYFNAYSIGTIRYNEAEMNVKDNPEASKRYCWNAFRAYANALKLAAEGGHDFHEAWDSFGKTKMYACLAELNRIHQCNNSGENDGGPGQIMPCHLDRKRYVKDITRYIDAAQKSVEESKIINKKYKDNFEDLVKYWNDFKMKYYSKI